MSLAGVETFEVTYAYYLGDNETKLNAQQVALRYAEREALERAGVFIESITIVQDYELTKDEIKAYTAGLVELVNQSGEWNIEGANFVYNLTARFRIDTDDVARQIERIRGSRELENQLMETQKETEHLYAELERVQAEQKIIVSNAIRATQLYYAVEEIIRNDKYQNAERALSMSREAFDLQPYNSICWNQLARTYVFLCESPLNSKTEKDIIREIWLEAKSTDDVGLWDVLGEFMIFWDIGIFSSSSSESLRDIGYNGTSRELCIYSLERVLNLISKNYSVYDIRGIIYDLNMVYREVGNYERIIELASLSLNEGAETSSFYIQAAYGNIAKAYINLGIYDKALKYAYEGKDADLNAGGFYQDDWDYLIEDIKSRM